MDIKGKTALVTGAAGGIGREFVRELLARGASKVIAAGMNAVKAGNWPAGVTPMDLDISNEAATIAAARAAGQRSFSAAYKYQIA